MIFAGNYPLEIGDAIFALIIAAIIGGVVWIKKRRK
jgi:hypothetical protein